MTRFFVISALCVLLVALGGCSAPAVPALGGVDSSARQAMVGQGGGPFLYVGGAAISQYALGGTTPLRSVRLQQDAHFTSLALDGAGRLLAIEGVGGLDVFDARTLRRIRFQSYTYPSSLAIGRNDDVYVANCGAGISIYSPGAAKRIGAIGAQFGACTVAVDRRGYIYVVNGYHLIDVYEQGKKPGAVRLVWRIRDGLRGPSAPNAIAFGPSGELFVSSYPGADGHSSVVEYARDAGTPERKITADLDLPLAIAVDSTGTLYVANDPGSWKRTDGWISVYGPTGDKPIGRIKPGINGPLALTTDSADNLYVANAYDSDVSVYAAKSMELLRRIRKGASDPSGLIIGE